MPVMRGIIWSVITRSKRECPCATSDDRFRRARRDRHVEAPAFEQIAHERADRLLVVDDEHVAAQLRAHAARARRERLRSLPPRDLPRAREAAREKRVPCARRGIDDDVAAELVHDAVHAREPHAAAFADVLRREERLEDAVDDVRRDAGPVVVDAKLDELAARRLPARGAHVLADGARARRSRDRADAVHRVARVETEVEQDLVEVHRVEHDRRHVVVDARFRSRASTGSDEPKSFTDCLTSGGERHRPRLAALAAAEREHLLDEIARAHARQPRLLEILLELRRRSPTRDDRPRARCSP